MTITQDIGSANVVAQGVDPLSFTVSLVNRSLSAASTPGTFHDSVTLTSTGAIVWNEAQITQNESLLEIAEYTSLRPDIATVDAEGYVTRVSDGLAKIRCTIGSISRVETVDVRQDGSGTVTEFSGYVAESSSDVLASALMGLMTEGSTLPYFSAYNVTANTFTKSNTCWAKDINLSGSAVATDIFGSWSTANRGALVTTRHQVGARHWGVSHPTSGNGYVIGTKLRYRGATGTIYERTVVGTASWGDLVVATLNTALPVDVSPMPIVGDWIHQSKTAVSGTTASYYAGGAVMFIDQQFQCKAMLIGELLSLSLVQTESTAINGDAYTGAITLISAAANFTSYGADFTGAKSTFFGAGVVGDSGSPVMVVIGGDPALYFTFYGPIVGPCLNNNNGALLNSLIAAADAAAGISTGLTVTVAPDPTL